MQHRWARWSLVVAAIAVVAGACLWALQLEGGLRRTRLDAVSAAAYARSGRTALGDVRRALAAMASPGQAAAGWSRRAEAGIDDARRQLVALSALTPGAAEPREALGVFERLGEAERRLREHATGGKPLMAADVAFGEAMPHVDDLERRLDAALDAVATATETQVAALRDRQVAALAGALAALLVAALILAPLPRPAAAATADAPTPAAAQEIAAAPIPDVAPPAAVVTPAPIAGALPAVDLAALGAACTTLAAVRDGGALPAALHAAVTAIGARGAMLWLADADRQALRPASAAGYDPRLLARLGPVAVGDDNPTARAFREGLTVSSAARRGQPPAAAVPVAGAAGVTGVLAVEFGDEAPAAVAAATAAAAIVAAQLSLLVTAVPEPESAPLADAAGSHGA